MSEFAKTLEEAVMRWKKIAEISKKAGEESKRE